MGHCSKTIRVLIGALTVAAAGCDSSTAPTQLSGLVERLEVRVSDAADPGRNEVSVAVAIPIPEEIGDWTVLGSEYLLGTTSRFGDSRRYLALAGGARGRVQIPGEFTAGEFDHVNVTVWAESRPRIRASFLDARKPVAQSAWLESARNQVAIAKIPIELPAGSSATKLELEILPGQKALRVFDIALTKIARETLLPSADRGAALYDLSGDARQAVGVSTRASLDRRFVVPKDAVLAFDYAWPRGVQDDSAEAGILLRLASDQKILVRQVYKLEIAEEPGWTHVEVPLGEWSGTAVQLQIGLRSRLTAEREFAALVSVPTLYVPDPAPATVLLVTSDTHRFDHLGKAGLGRDVKTPFLDALADRGVFFDNCLSSTNVTLPSHVALMTGTSPRDTGILDNNVPLKDAAPTLAEHFAAAGFATLAVVAAEHLGDPESNLGQGFDRMAWPRGAADAGDVVDRVLRWSEDYEGRSLFVWAHVFDAHTPYDPPAASFVEEYYTRDPRDPELPDPHFPQPPGSQGLRDVAYVHALYNGEVTYLDRELGRLFGAPRFSEGVVAFTADHGESFGDHDIWWTHAGLYPATIHIPLIMTWPGAPVGRRESRPVRQIEVGRTLLDLAGLGGTPFPGRSLVELLDAPEEPRFAISAQRLDASVTLGHWHLVLPLRPDSLRKSRLHEVELYDLARDRACAESLAQEDFERARALRGLLVEWLGQRSPDDWAGDARTDEDTLEALAELGYVIDAAATDVTLFDPDCDCEFCRPFREGREGRETD